MIKEGIQYMHVKANYIGVFQIMTESLQILMGLYQIP